jgi:FlaA1/EpsC-like NDP-sugar epimerase
MLRRHFLHTTFKLFDLLVMAFSFSLAFRVSYARYYAIPFTEFLHMRIKVENAILFAGFIFLWRTIFFASGLYYSRRLDSRWLELYDLIKATTLGTLVLLAASFAFSIDVVTPVFLAVFWVSSTAILVLSRVVLRYALARMRLRGRNLRFVLVAGTNPRAVDFALKLASKRELGYRILGFVDDYWDGIEEFQKTDYPLVCGFTQLPSYIRENVVDEMVIGLPMKSAYQQAARLVNLCEEQGIIVRFIPSIFDLKLACSIPEQFEGESVITVFTGKLEDWQFG